MTLVEILREALQMLSSSLENKVEDNELSDTEIEDMIVELEHIIDALQYELECRQEACHTASDRGASRLEI